MTDSEIAAGDIGLVHYTGDFNTWCISVAQRRKYGTKYDAAKWEHAFMLTDDVGNLIEAQPRGMKEASLGEYAGREFIICRPPWPVGGATRAVTAMHEMLDEKYGNLQIACEILCLLTDTRLRFGIANERICSGAVSVAAVLGGIVMVPPTCIVGDGLGSEGYNTPADIRAIEVVQHWIEILRHDVPETK